MNLRLREAKKLKYRSRKVSKALIACQQRFQALVMACSDIFYRMNADWSEMHQLHGKRLLADTCASKTDWMAQYIPPDEHGRVIASIKAALASKAMFVLEHQVFLADGKIGWTKSRAIPVLDENNEVKEWFGIASDVTDTITCQLAQKKEHASLIEDNRQKDHFLAVLSHELRNPLMPISNCLEILEADNMPSSQIEKAITVMRRQVDHLTRLTDDLFDLNRIAKNKIQVVREHIDFCLITQEAVENHQSQFQAAGVQLNFFSEIDSAHICGDPNRLMQVLGNLLSNACKFTPRGGSANLVLNHVDKKWVELRITDRGVGIHPDLMAHIFEPFVQADSNISHSNGGLGLGLALCRSIIKMHDGIITGYSGGAMQGAQFILRLPIDQSSGVVPQRVESKVEHCRRRILIIEDNIDAAETLQQLLEFDGHDVEVAYNGFEGLRRARMSRPEVILCDIGLPQMDGYAVVKAIRQDPTFKCVVIALSGYGLASDIQQARNAGFDHHLVKPPSIKQLKSMIVGVHSAA